MVYLISSKRKLSTSPKNDLGKLLDFFSLPYEKPFSEQMPTHTLYANDEFQIKIIKQSISPYSKQGGQFGNCFPVLDCVKLQVLLLRR